jgi:hypothetical protein
MTTPPDPPKPKAQRQHYVPIVLLRNFANPIFDENGKLFVFDFERKRDWPGQPKTQARETNLYDLQPKTHPNPRKAEQFFGTIEAKSGPVLRKLIQDPAYRLSADEFRPLMCLIACQVIRTPLYFDYLDSVLRKTLVETITPYAKSKASRRRFSQWAKAHGVDASVTPELMIDSCTNTDRWQVTSDVDWKLAMTFKLLPEFTSHIAARNWWRVPIGDDVPPLIVSDRGPSDLPMSPEDESGTVLAMPIAPRMVLLGSRSAKYQKLVKRLDGDAVAILNQHTASGAVQVYGSESDFHWMHPFEHGRHVRWSEYKATGFPEFDIPRSLRPPTATPTLPKSPPPLRAPPRGA